jgi:lysosomal alpha-mannosidase
VINVHVICHTHLDPGWLNSLDGYFFGIQYNRNENNAGRAYRHVMPSVLTIFNNVIGALLENSKRRFVMVEMSFIWRWWKRLDDDYKQIIRKLMNEGKFYLLDFRLKVHLMIFQDVLI